MTPAHTQVRLQLAYLMAAERYLRQHDKLDEAEAVHAAIDLFMQDHAQQLRGPIEPYKDFA